MSVLLLVFHFNDSSWRGDGGAEMSHDERLSFNFELYEVECNILD